MNHRSLLVVSVMAPLMLRPAAADTLPNTLVTGFTFESIVNNGNCVGAWTTGVTEFRRNGSTGNALISLEQNAYPYFYGLGFRNPSDTLAEYFVGTATMTFSDASDGTITFDETVNGIGTAANSFPFSGYSQFYSAASGQLRIAFTINWNLVSGCFVPISASYRVHG